MSKTFYYDTSNNMEDERWQNNNMSDITSIVDALESGQIDKIIGTEPPDISGGLLRELNAFDDWLNRSLYPGLFVVKHYDLYTKLLSKLQSIQRRINVIFSKIPMSKHCRNKIFYPRDKRGSVCGVCDEEITVGEGRDFLYELERHDHIAEIMNDKMLINEIKNKQKEREKFQELLKNINNVVVSETTSKDETMKRSDVDESSETISTSSSVCVRNSENSTSDDTSSSFASIPPSDINAVLYPTEITKEFNQAQQSNILTVQNIKPGVYRCLLCNNDHAERQMLRHVGSPYHFKNLQNQLAVEKIQRYHDLFVNLPRAVAVHQVCFLPMIGKFLRCKICNCNFADGNFYEHINGFKHRRKLVEKVPIRTSYFYTEIIQSIQQGIIEKYIKSHDTSQDPSSSTENNLDACIYHLDGHRVKILDKNKERSSSKENEPKPAKKPEPPKKEHNVVLSIVEDPQTMFDRLERRFHEHRKFVLEKENELSCTICNLTMRKHHEILKMHFISQTHLRNARKDITRKRWIYSCDLCPKVEHSEVRWFEHLNNVTHRQRLDAILKAGTLKGGEFQEHECDVCLTVIFGNNFSINRHIKEAVSKSRKKKKEYKLPAYLQKLLLDNSSLDAKITKLTIESDKTLELNELNVKCCRAIEMVLQRLFPACRAWPFGSRVSGIGCLESDLDVFVDTGRMYDGMFYQDEESQATLVRQVTKELRKNPDFDDVNPIPNARTPIVQVFHKITKLDCDLSFRHGLSVENTDFLRLCIDVQPVVQPLILIIKYWAHQCYFDKVSTYALAMMAIFYMQVENYLPTVKLIREIDTTPSRVIAGWQTFRFTKPLEEIQAKISRCTLNPRELFKNFFHYYMQFNFEKDIICPLLGRLILKEDFDKERSVNLPPEMVTYVQKIQLSDQSERFRHLAPMCIQDPFDLSHNLTKACPIDYVTRFQQYCQMSYNILAGAETNSTTSDTQ